ncbi:MAG: non-canonical purine NTP diphosphatase [Bacteroidales bacterium]|nr:non-canonical purine NTP diphosphatase [Bacteroidales bacterium]HPD95114.1 non-canonical purine NTP diphosphatase [Tenuifilaceae bacterium]HRX31526.1 non-canonical purine NTP diphosphatase [Tenuifilaceae bacterium]
MAGTNSQIVFATNNLNKLYEVQNILGNQFKLVTPIDLGISEDIPEDFDTLEQNALQKARYIFQKTGISCFADDTGLEVEALNGAPGVYSARYAGLQKDPKDNIRKLLNEIKGAENRNARFRTVVALIYNAKEHLFEGIVDGKIIDQERGQNGFGYDPIFVPNGYTLTFAELPLSEKNKISHRAKAIQGLVEFLHGTL